MKDELDIIIVDDHKLFRQSLKLLLHQQMKNVRIREAENGKKLLELMNRRKELPDIILLDLEMPVMDGIEVVRHLLSKKKFKDLKIIVLTMHHEKSFILDLIEEGVHGYLLKDAEISEMFEAINQVKNGQYYVSQQTFDAIRQDVATGSRFKNKLNMGSGMLTRREEEILLLICREYTNKEMADELNLSVRTIDGHRNRLLKKTGMKNTAGLVKYAVRSGFYSLD